MDTHEHDMVEARDVAWVLSRLDLSGLEHGNINEICDDQSVPSRSGFNSLITDENLPERIVGFLPVIPHAITDRKTVYTALKNFQGKLQQLQQSKMAVTCDEGVYHIEREIMLEKPGEFENLVLCLDSFHMIKVVLGCIGKYGRPGLHTATWSGGHAAGAHAATWW